MRLPENSRPVWHLYPFRYDAAQFNGLSRDKFVRAMGAEGIPCGGGYHEQYYDGLLDEAIASRGFKRLFVRRAAEGLPRQLPGVEGQQAGLRDDRRHVPESCCWPTAATWITSSTQIRKIQAHSAGLAKVA